MVMAKKTLLKEKQTSSRTLHPRMERKLKELGHSRNGCHVGYQQLLIVVIIHFQRIDCLLTGIPSLSHLFVQSIFSRERD